MINKELDELHGILESPIPRLPNKPCLPKIKIKNEKWISKKTHLSKPYNRQAIVGFRAATTPQNNYLSQIKNNTKSYVTNFSSIYSPTTASDSSWLLAKGKLYKKTTSTFLETNAWSSMLSNCDNKLKRNPCKDESTSSLLRNKLSSNSIVKNKQHDLDYIIKSTKAKLYGGYDIKHRDRTGSKTNLAELIEENDEYNVKKEHKNSTKEYSVSTVAAMVYGERSIISKYKNRPKFMENLNATLSPRKEAKICLTCTSKSSTQIMPHILSTALKQR